MLEIRKVCVPGLACPETPLKVNEVGDKEMVGREGWLTLKLVPESAQLVAPLEAVQPKPLILAVPEELPVTVLPDTDATPELLLLYEPPDQPPGAVAVTDCPGVILEELKATLPDGQTEAAQEMFVPMALL